MTLAISLGLEPPAPVFGEPIVARMVVCDDDTDRTFPIDPTDGSLLTFELLDAADRVLVRADGAARDLRLGHAAPPRPAAALPTFTLPEGVPFPFEDDLQTYLAFPRPGRFRLRVRLCFPPGGVDAWSEPLAVEVAPPRVRHLDCVVDRVAMPVLHLLLQHADGPTVATFHPLAAPGTPWCGTRLHGVPAGPGRLSVAGFTNEAGFADDFRRWSAWVDGDALVLASHRERHAGVVVRLPLGGPASTLTGAPIQRADGGVDVLLQPHTVAPGAPLALRRLSVAPGGTLEDDRVVPLGATGVRVIAQGVDDARTVHALLAAPGASEVMRLQLPLDGAGAPSVQPWLRAEDLRDATLPPAGDRLGAFVLARPLRRSITPTTAVVGVALEDGRPLVWVAERALSINAMAMWVFDRWSWPLATAEADYGAPARAALAQDEHGALIVVVATTRGALLQLVPDQPPHELVRLDPAAAASVTLISLGRGVAAVVPDADVGFRYLRLESP